MCLTEACDTCDKDCISKYFALFWWTYADYEACFANCEPLCPDFDTTCIPATTKGTGGPIPLSVWGEGEWTTVAPGLSTGWGDSGNNAPPNTLSPSANPPSGNTGGKTTTSSPWSFDDGTSLVFDDDNTAPTRTPTTGASGSAGTSPPTVDFFSGGVGEPQSSAPQTTTSTSTTTSGTQMHLRVKGGVVVRWGAGAAGGGARMGRSVDASFAHAIKAAFEERFEKWQNAERVWVEAVRGGSSNFESRSTLNSNGPGRTTRDPERRGRKRGRRFLHDEGRSSPGLMLDVRLYRTGRRLAEELPGRPEAEKIPLPKSSPVAFHRLGGWRAAEWKATSSEQLYWATRDMNKIPDLDDVLARGVVHFDQLPSPRLRHLQLQPTEQISSLPIGTSTTATNANPTATNANAANANPTTNQLLFRFEISAPADNVPAILLELDKLPAYAAPFISMDAASYGNPILAALSRQLAGVVSGMPAAVHKGWRTVGMASMVRDQKSQNTQSIGPHRLSHDMLSLHEYLSPTKTNAVIVRDCTDLSSMILTSVGPSRPTFLSPTLLDDLGDRNVGRLGPARSDRGRLRRGPGSGPWDAPQKRIRCAHAPRACAHHCCARAWGARHALPLRAAPLSRWTASRTAVVRGKCLLFPA